MENNEILMDDEEVSVVTFTDENGEECQFEYLDCIDYEGKEYLVLTPAEEDAAELKRGAQLRLRGAINEIFRGLDRQCQ